MMMYPYGMNLKVVVSNPTPQREHNSPQAWILHTKASAPVRLVVVHDAQNHPRVISREAA